MRTLHGRAAVHDVRGRRRHGQARHALLQHVPAPGPALDSTRLLSVAAARRQRRRHLAAHEPEFRGAGARRAAAGAIRGAPRARRPSGRHLRRAHSAQAAAQPLRAHAGASLRRPARLHAPHRRRHHLHAHRHRQARWRRPAQHLPRPRRRQGLRRVAQQRRRGQHGPAALRRVAGRQAHRERRASRRTPQPSDGQASHDDRAPRCGRLLRAGEHLPQAREQRRARVPPVQRRLPQSAPRRAGQQLLQR
mmetsp:Transcript_49640/g.119549  ORF Transcript_49640/g.119549 Transcript_49640/m.119549 type:complete len:249 (-) Transcript_49640:71-817(-)